VLLSLQNAELLSDSIELQPGDILHQLNGALRQNITSMFSWRGLLA
jgi:hypothetical protein